MRFAHGPITEKDGNRGKCRKCGEWYLLPFDGLIPAHECRFTWVRGGYGLGKVARAAKESEEPTNE